MDATALAYEASQRNTLWYEGMLSDHEYFGWLDSILAALYLDYPY